jgi:ribonuclease HI
MAKLARSQGSVSSSAGMILGESDASDLSWKALTFPRNVSEALPGDRQTNQRAELMALKRALDICPLNRNTTIFSDSNYAIKCVTEWCKNWMKNGWLNSSRKPVENRDIIEDVIERIDERTAAKVLTKFSWLKGHANDPGNVAADELAVKGAIEARANGSGSENATPKQVVASTWWVQ